MMRQLFNGVFLLEGEVGGRPLQLMYLRGDLASLLMDTGCAHDPSRFIVPQMRELDGDPASLTWILNTHSDLDHIGGNHEMKQFAPRAVLACGDADRHICESFETLMRYRYDLYRAEHQIFYEGEAVDWLRANAGPPQCIEATFRGKEHIRLGADWEVEVLSVPGHSKGHLAVYDPLHKALYGADAIHGRGYPGLDGRMKLCPTYEDVDDYLATVALIENLPITTYVGCHWPVKKDSGIREFCAESRSFVEETDRLLMELLKSPYSLRELCLAVAEKLGTYPRSADLDLVYALAGHLRRLVEQGLVIASWRAGERRILEYARLVEKANCL